MTDTVPGSGAAARLITFRATLWSLVIVEVFSGVIQVYFTPIYPTLAKQFGVNVGVLAWALTGYTLATAVCTPFFARLGDVYGHSRILKIEVGIVAAGCVLIAVAPTFWVLVVGRVLQGCFAAYLPLMFGLVRHRHSSEQTTTAVSFLSAVLIFGVFAGLLAVSFILRAPGGPAWVLWLPAIGSIVGFIVLFIRRGPTFVRDPDATVDWTGVALLAVGFAGVILGLSQGPAWGWGSPGVLSALIGGIIVLAIWVAVELRVPHPMIDMRYVFRPHLVPVYIVGFIIYFGAIGTQVATSTFMGLPRAQLGYGLGLSASAIGFFLVPGYLVMFIVITFTAKLGRAIGFRWTIFLGTLSFLVGYAGELTFHQSLVGFLVASWIAAGGFGFIEAATRTVVVQSLREGEVSVGEGVYELSITVGGAIGAALTGAILAASLNAKTGVADLSGYLTLWALLTVLGVVATVVAAGYAIVERRRRDDSTHDDRARATV